MADEQSVMLVGGHEFKMTSPSRVLYPAAGTTEAEVIDYYLQFAGVMLPHLAGRPATRNRWPHGVDGPDFFARDLEVGTPRVVDPSADPAHLRPEVLPGPGHPGGAGVARAGVGAGGARPAVAHHRHQPGIRGWVRRRGPSGSQTGSTLETLFTG